MPRDGIGSVPKDRKAIDLRCNNQNEIFKNGSGVNTAFQCDYNFERRMKTR